MTFNDLVQKYAWSVIEPVFLKLHPHESHALKTFGVAYDQLRHLEPVPADLSIVIEEIWDEIDQCYIIDVYGTTKVMHDDVSESHEHESTKTESQERFGLDFVLWPEWLDMQINENTLAHYTAEEIISHCLYEMTFYGHTLEEVTEHRDRVFSQPNRRG
jgi:hypothetical protein